MAYCGKCGQKNPEGSKFCFACGSPLETTGSSVVNNETGNRSEATGDASSPGRMRVQLRRESTPPLRPSNKERESEPYRRQRESLREDKQPRRPRYRVEEEEPRRSRFRDEEEEPRKSKYRDEEEAPRRRRYRKEKDYDDEYGARKGGGFISNLVRLVKRSFLIIAIGAVAVFLIMWLFSKSDVANSEGKASSADGDTPEQTALVAGSDGGQWQTMESGEIVYAYDGDKYASNVWIKDDGKVYYVDPLGCRMLNNYAHDGYYAGADGSWVKSKERLTGNQFPHNSVKYTNETSSYVVFSIFNNDQGEPTGTAEFCSTDSNEGDVFDVKYLGHSTFLLTYKDDAYNKIHMAVVDGSQTIIMSSAGETHVMRVNN